ncbi:MAG: tyrosine-type recombinase/integrase [Bacillota bacterium]|jgi:site-specific recombinase XerD|nr:tyrosine-type recombinase/integrase [Bacillota bacterium]NLP22737.1 tyrosine-type recombinase/integrase [Erysipelotrichaceae bacterium]
MKTELIREIEQSMLNYLDNAQLEILHKVLLRATENLKVIKNDDKLEGIEQQYSNEELISKFINAKQIEGCSDKTIKYYKSTLLNLLKFTLIHINHLTTDDLREYLSEYQKINNCSKTNVDNIRRILSSFFSWLEEENYILKSPMKRIKKIKTDKVIKETYSDEVLEMLRDSTNTLRDLAIIDLLSSTGMRVGELVKLNIVDIDFENRECVVFGKGNKERPVYFDARTKIHLKNYLESREDDNPALFVSLNKPYNRLKISGVEIRLRELGRSLGITRVYPHKFRRTLATRAIDKGMPIEQVQSLLGHSQIDTTMKYAMVNQNNVKISHKKYIS